MRKISFTLLLSSIFLLSCLINIADAYEKEIKAMSSSLSDNISKSGKKSIAVVDFTDLQGNVTELGRFLAEEFSVALSESGKGFEVVDRSQLSSILKEQKFSLSGLVDKKTVQKLGAIAGVQCLVTGTLTPFGDSIRITVKVLDVSTAKVIGGSRGDIAKTKAIEDLLSEGVNASIASTSKKHNSGKAATAVGGKNSKKYGDLVFTIKKIAITGTRSPQINLMFSVLNQANYEIKIARNPSVTRINDDRGNSFETVGGSLLFCFDTMLANQGQGVVLPENSNTDLTLEFKPTAMNVQREHIGTIFDLTLGYYSLKTRDRILQNGQVSFSDLKVPITR